MKKVRILVIVVFLLLCTTVIFSYGKPEVVFKKKTEEIVQPSSYKPTVLWPRTGNSEEAGEGSGVAINSKGDIYYLHRASGKYSGSSYIKEPTIVVLDGRSKAVKDTWGEGMFKSPHGITIDKKDQIWITDITLNKIYKLSPEGKLIKTFGEDYPVGMDLGLRIRNKLPNFPVIMNENTFARPTDVTVLGDESFVVSDGYRNHRIAKFNANGKLEWQVNKLGRKMGEFNLPHGISSDAEGRIYVADRNNARIQVFNRNGKPIENWDQAEIGRPYGVEVGRDQNIYVVDGGDYLNGKRNNLTSQVIVLNKEGHVKERFGSWGKEEGQLKIPHDIAVDQVGNLYVAELMNKRLQEFKKQ